MEECDYTNQFVYEFEDQNLLSALLSVPKMLTEDYYWGFNTQFFPWGLSLKVSIIPVTDIRYKKNITGIRKRTNQETYARDYIFMERF